jgi:hypothetical protein
VGVGEGGRLQAISLESSSTQKKRLTQADAFPILNRVVSWDRCRYLQSAYLGSFCFVYKFLNRSKLSMNGPQTMLKALVLHQNVKSVTEILKDRMFSFDTILTIRNRSIVKQQLSFKKLIN